MYTHGNTDGYPHANTDLYADGYAYKHTDSNSSHADGSDHQAGGSLAGLSIRSSDDMCLAFVACSGDSSVDLQVIGRGIAATLEAEAPAERWPAVTSTADRFTPRPTGTKVSPTRATTSGGMTPSPTPELPILSAREGNRIAFVSDRDGQAELYLLHVEEKYVARLTDNLLEEGRPTWSPDGRSLVFASTLAGSGSDSSTLYSLDLETLRTTDLPGALGWSDFSPRFSPDGTKIVLVSRHGEEFDLLLSDSAMGSESG